MTNDPVEVTCEGSLRLIRMNRAEKKNALTAPMYEAMTEALHAAERDVSVCAVVFLGSQGVFTAGNDLADFLARKDHSGARPAHAFIQALTDATVPLVAAVEGPAVGIGTTMLLHCDFVYVAPDARLALPFVNLGVCPEAGSSLLLPRLTGYLRAAELLLLGDPIDGQRALEYGIATAVVEHGQVEAAALATARRLAAKPAEALRASKRLLKRPEEAVHTRVEAEIAVFSALLGAPAARELMAAFVEKRAPDRSRYA